MTDWKQRYSHLKLEQHENGILEVIFNRPETLNSVDAPTHTELTYIWQDIHRDEEITAVVVHGTGKAFSAGGDFGMVEDNTKPENYARTWKEGRDLVYNMVNCNKPVLSAVEGAAAGAGLAVAMLSDITVAGRSAKFVDGHVRLGVAAGDNATLTWPLLMGMAKAKYYLLLNEPLRAEEAERLGLIARVVNDGEALSTTMGLAERLVAGSPSAIRWTKYSLNNWYRLAGPIFDTSMSLEMLGFAMSDVKEGVASWREKRQPNFEKKSPL